MSPKAYIYVREKFNNSLPHPSTITKWYGNLHGDVGILKEAISAIESHVKTKPDLLLNLVFDEMSIRKHIDFNGNQNIGFVDLGDGHSINNKAASNALVFMVVAVNDSWKIPIAYFFTNY